jgi:hypothetical protein
MRKVPESEPVINWLAYGETQSILHESGHGPTPVLDAAAAMVPAIGADLLRRDLFGAGRTSKVQ